MKRIFVKSALQRYWERFPDTEQYLKIWYQTAMRADWKSPNDVKAAFATASILKSGRIVFNIKGNAHRLVVQCNFQKQWIFIRFIGTHEEYDRINANEI